MTAVLTKAACFIAIIVMGYVLRKKNFFKEGDFQILSRIVLNITLPAAIVTSVANKEISPSLLFISLLGLLGGVCYVVIMYLINRKASREQMAFDVVNTPGYNIGNFTMPFVQSFLGPIGVLTVSLFDVGNAMVCLGGAYGVASILKDGGKFDIKRVADKVLHSIPFDTYVIMLLLGMFHVRIPEFVTQFSGIIGGGNAFLAMLMIGVGFNLSGDRSQIGHMAKILSVRYGVAIVLSFVFFNFLPLDLEYRQALAVLVFSPIGTAAPVYTSELKGDVGLSSAINSVSIIISIVCIVAVLALVL